MKKRLLLLSLVVPLFAFTLSSCDDIDRGALLELEHVSGLKDQYMLYTEVDLLEVNVKATFEKGVVNVTGKDLTFNPTTLDTGALGLYDLKITYLTKTITWSYEVVEFDEIDNLALPESIRAYQANIEEKGENKRSEFFDREQGYFVGTNNPWRFFPEIYAYDEDGLEMDVTAYHSSSKVYELRGNQYVLLSGAELESIVTIDEFRSTYHFSSEALNKTYKVSVRPYGEKYESNAKYEVSFEFNVVLGYNVTKQDDLTHFDNYNVEWAAYREAKQISPVDIDGLILHDDIKLLPSHLADGFFYLEGDDDVKRTDEDFDRVVGSLRDHRNLYYRALHENEEFIFNGNYFNIDYTALPYVVREGSSGNITVPGEVVSHLSIFHVGGYDDEVDTGQFIMKNLSSTGNANRTETKEKSGGGMFLKLSKTKVHFYNIIATQSFTILISEETTSKVLIEKTRGYDSFSSFLYAWGTQDFEIRDSEFIGAGGPVIIADHVSPNVDGTGGYQPDVKVLNSHLESYVFGQENWFKLVHADPVVPSILGLGELVSAYGTNSILRGEMINGQLEHKFNLVGVIKDGSSQAPTSSKISGKFQIDNTVGLDFNGQFMQAVAPYFPAAAPRLQSSGGEMALYTGGAKLLSPTGQELPYFHESLENYFSGDYLNVYFNIPPEDGFMGIIFGLSEYQID